MSPLTIFKSLRSTPVQPAMLGGLPPPPGVVPNFVNPDFIADTIRAVAISLAVVTTLSTGIRLYTKFFIVKAHGWEDYTMFIAWAGFIAWIAVGLQDLKYGLGTHQWDVPITKLVSLALWANLSEILYSPLIAITRLSICLQFAHIFVLNRDKKFWCLQVFIWVNMLYFIALFFVTIFQCTPRAKIWNPEIPGKCLRYQAYNVATGLFNVVSDFLMLVFPIFCIWNLQMSNKRKVGVSAIFFVGSLALTASILRVVFSGISDGSQDQTFNVARVGECTVGEVAAGILVGNLVVFPRFFTTYVPKVTRLLSSYRSRRSSEPLLDTAIPTKASPSWLMRTPNAKPSAAWPSQHSAKSLPEDFVELKEQAYKAGGLVVPYTGGGDFSPITNISGNTGNHEPRPYEFRGSGNEAEEGRRIWKTVHVNQSARHVQ